MKDSNLLVVTPGDPAGIGPEVVWKGIQKNHLAWKSTPLLCIGAMKPFAKLRAPIIIADANDLKPPTKKGPFIWLLPAPEKAPPKKLAAGYQVGWSIEEATKLVRTRIASALVTGPISKERLRAGGYLYKGHTDFLAALCGDIEITMMLANPQLRVSLVTTHCALKDVPGKITRASIHRAIDQTYTSLREWWGIRRPKIAVCGLNPHAGENGILGREEIATILPTIVEAQEKYGRSALITGPFPSDTLFAKNHAAKPGDRVDAVIAMYHDQGLIPVKLIDFPNTVNLTLGLPILRTSVDHGTAFDIAGKNLADPSSFIAAVETARHFTAVKTQIKGRAS